MTDPKVTALRSEARDFVCDMAKPVVQTEYEVLRMMRDVTGRFGWRHFMIARIPHGEQQRFSERLVLSSWSAELVRQYDAASMFNSSALVERLRQTKLPVLGGVELFLATGDRAGADILSTALVDGGIVETFAVLLHATSGEAFAVTLAGARRAPDRAETAELYFELLQVFEALERTFSAGFSVKDKLSAREIECLRWAAAGKSSDEIAIILDISTYTVSSYFKSATRKLDAVNRMQAIARAMRMRLI